MLLFDVGVQKLTCLTEISRHFQPDQPLRIAFDPTSFLFFCPETGMSLMD